MKEYIEDLKFMIEKYEENFVAPYYCFSKEQLNDYIAEYLKNNIINNDLDFLYFLKCIIKKLNGILDEHTVVKRKRQFFPFIFKLLDNELYIINTTEENKKYLYSKLISVNDVPYKNLISEIDKTICYSTDGYKKRNLEREFDELFSLLYLPSIKTTKNEINLKFKGWDNNILNFSFSENDITAGIELKNKNCSFNVEGNTIHYIYNSCLLSYKNDVINSVKQLKKELAKNEIKNFILDLRDNSGGSSLLIEPLIELLSKSTLNLYVFVNRYTFSSGVFALMDMLKLGAITIGEDIGSTINHFGELVALYKLPNTKFDFRITTKYFLYNKDKFKFEAIKSQEEFKSMVTKQDLIPIYFKPDYFVEEHIVDYKNGRDIYMEEFRKIKDKKKLKH